MVWLTRLSRFTLLAVLAVALTLGLAVKVPAQVPALLRPSSLSSQLPEQWGENSFSLPRTSGPGAPVNTQGGGTRGPCFKGDKNPVALVPAPQMGETTGIGETVAEYPTIFWYMPKISLEEEKAPGIEEEEKAPGIEEEEKAPGIEFVLKVSDKRMPIVYSAKYALAKSAEGVVGAPGIMSLSLAPSNFPSLSPLEIDKEYYWELTTSCNYTDSDNSDDFTVDGRLKRVEADPTLARRIQQATPQERVALYAEKRLWNETLASLIELRRDRPNDQNLADAWGKLLTSVGLDVISKEPLFQGDRAFNTSSYSN